jgi:DNA ligase (NAD+)
MSTFSLPVVKDCQSVGDCFIIESEQQLAQLIGEADKRREWLDLPTDGLVFKLNDFEKHRELGEGNKYPKYACAYKFPPERKTTALIGVTLQVGRTGKITPVAELQPVGLSGTVVRRASLCNQDEIQRLRVNIGDHVYVEKSAEIIPKVVGVEYANFAFIGGKLDLAASGGPPDPTSDETPLEDFAKKVYYRFPSKCPCCKAKLVKPEGYVDFFCPNKDCDDQVFETLRHACGKSALDIDGCGEVLVREMMKHGVRKLSDVFTLDPLFMKTAVRKRFENGRNACVSQPLWRKFHALGIEGFGQTLCREVASQWTSLSSAWDDSEALIKLVGEAVYKNIIAYLTDSIDEFAALDDAIGLSCAEEASGPLTGKSFCITGNLISGSRPTVERRIEEAGGIAKSAVTRHLSFLIQGSETGTVKRTKAAQYGIPVITEQQLYEMMGQEMPLPKNIVEKEY